MSKGMKNKIWAAFLVLVWGVAVLYFVAELGVQHSISFLPTRLGVSVSKATDVAEDELQVTHVLASGCKCSESVAKYLLQDLHGVTHQKVVWVGEKSPYEEALKKLGYQFEYFDKEQISREELQGVPTLLISKADQIIYAGGYSAQRIFKPEEVKFSEIYLALKEGRRPTEWPIFGCATAQKYRKVLDPWGFKYSFNHEEANP